jgi:hypothetical protein
MFLQLSTSSIFFATALAACWRDIPCTGPSEAAFPGPWQSYIYAPADRKIPPRSIISLPNGAFISTYADASNITISNSLTGLVFDFGLEVGGILTIDYTLSGAPAILGLAFSEAKNYIGRKSDNSNGASGADGALAYNITTVGSGSYIMPDAVLRGGFRYATIFLDSTSPATLKINSISLEISFQPTWSDMRAYQGYFQSNDELLNKIWYSGAYTLQTNSVPGNTGRHATNLKSGWQNDEYCGSGNSVLLDGAKRDRWVWIGDMGVAVPSSFVSTGDMESTKNALLAIWDNQVSHL